MPLKGDAAFRYTPPGGSLTTVALEWPLWRKVPGRAQRRYASDSLDLTAREVLVVGSGVDEAAGTIRFHGDAVELLDMLEAGAAGVVLTYYPSLASPGTSFPMWLIEPSADRIDLIAEAARRSRGEWTVAIRVRATSGGSFAGLFS
ncbi:hypothetical protein [Gaopeijia maritima]|uniref:hypothetical protein n=1 Tax=Gaopeijia maritima TaxID=3119007 RepID=UPI00327909D7